MTPAPGRYHNLVDKLTRVTTSGRRIPEVDGLRFIAIFLVFVQHVYQSVLSRYQPGQAPPLDQVMVLIRDSRCGVELFFLISGFILALPFAAQHLFGSAPVSLRAYYKRRITRLEPPYLITLVLWFAVLVLYWHESWRSQLPHLIASGAYLHNLIYDGPSTYMSTINPVAWSLEVEVQFYFIAPVLALVFVIKDRLIRRGVMIAAAIATSQILNVFNHFDVWPMITILLYLPMFMMGFLLADIYLIDWDQQPRGRLRFDLIAIPGWTLLLVWFQLIEHGWNGRRFLPNFSFSFLLFFLCWASFRSRLTRRFLASPFVVTVGGMCYSIYLLHFPLIRILANYSPLVSSSIAVNTLVYFVLWGIPVLAVSAAFFLLIEKPCMRNDWPRRLSARLRGLPVTPDAPRPAGQTQAEAILDVPTAATGPLAENPPVP